MAKIKEKMVINHPCYQESIRMDEVKGIIIGSIGDKEERASAIIEELNKPDSKLVPPHFIIDMKNHFIYQTLPWETRSWFSIGKYNYITIGVCELSTIDIKKDNGEWKISYDSSYESKRKNGLKMKYTFNSLVNLCAMICQKYNLEPDDSSIMLKSEVLKLLDIPNTEDKLYPLLYLFFYSKDKLIEEIENVLKESKSEGFIDINYNNPQISKIKVGSRVKIIKNKYNYRELAKVPIVYNEVFEVKEIINNKARLYYKGQFFKDMDLRDLNWTE